MQFKLSVNSTAHEGEFEGSATSNFGVVSFPDHFSPHWKNGLACGEKWSGNGTNFGVRDFLISL